MKLNIRIHNLKSIGDIEIDIPTTKGLYAITGQNGAGKSTLVTASSCVFFNLPMNDYFGVTEEDSKIQFKLGDGERSWQKENGKWKSYSNRKMQIKGFYEGSLIFGNRFRNTNYRTLKKLDSISTPELEKAPDFIKENFGLILQNNKDFYEELFILKRNNPKSKYNFSRDIFYYKKNGKRVSQFHMSTGENLLVSILNSLYIRNQDRANLNKPCLIFLDEIELALHPSSLKRLIKFLEEISNQYNYAIYFSTHSIELISGINPSNIFFLERYPDNTLEVLNPCYPAYATRILYDHSGYDSVILVEDDLAKSIIDRLLRKNHLLSNKMIHVLPGGGYTNVIDLAQEVISSNLMGKLSKILIILDGDVKEEAKAYISKKGHRNNIPLNFLPMESLEKFLKNTLIDNVDKGLYRLLNDYIFQQKSIRELIEEYQKEENHSNDNDGKKFFKYIDTELRERNKNRNDLVEMIVEYLFEKSNKSLEKITEFLNKQLR